MRIFYPYNEILPKKKAHDVFIVHECSYLAQAGYEVTLLCGKGSHHVHTHYHIPHTTSLHIEPQWILRKNMGLPISWNMPFFLCTQRAIEKKKPDFVFLSVRKQGLYHLQRKVPAVRYLYEVHELSSYGQKEEAVSNKAFREEKMLLERADLITVTTTPLQKILREPPYSLKTPIAVIPLAVQAHTLPPPKSSASLTVMYIGQLYPLQGVDFLLRALQHTEGVKLKIVGGSSVDQKRLFTLAKELQLLPRVEFLGFIPPARLSSVAVDADAFIAPFGEEGRMPYVAHTKLFEYAHLGRPIIAPDLPVVREHFCHGLGALLFQAGNIESLVNTIHLLKDSSTRNKLQQDSFLFYDKFSWRKRTTLYQNFLDAPLQFLE